MSAGRRTNPQEHRADLVVAGKCVNIWLEGSQLHLFPDESEVFWCLLDAFCLAKKLNFPNAVVLQRLSFLAFSPHHPAFSLVHDGESQFH